MIVVQLIDRVPSTEIVASNGVAQVKSERPFCILVANFNQRPRTLQSGQIIAMALPHHTVVMPSHVMLGNVLAVSKLVTDDDDDDPARP